MARIWGWHETAQAAAALKAGGLVAFPTETVYGLGALAGREESVARVFAVKGRPAHNPLIAHVADVESALALLDLPAGGRALAEAFWPGPLTLVAQRRPDAPLCPAACAGLRTAAVRVPGHPVAQALLRSVGAAVAAPSANPSGRLSPTTAAHVLVGLGPALAGPQDGVLDGGSCAVGVESTIVGFEGERPVLLRPGGVAAEDVEAALGRPLTWRAVGADISAPGQMPSHYAPAAKLRLNAKAPRAGEAWLGFGPDAAELQGPARNLSPEGDVDAAAAALFGHLRALDDALGGQGVIAVAAVPSVGRGLAVNDRLRRAAAPR
jgi:L-threonylcarbamoyladenylate synthase